MRARQVFVRAAGMKIMSLLLIALLLDPWAVSAQLESTDTQFVEGNLDVPCPPEFSSIYYDARSGMTFHGRSRFSMRQYDEYHASVLYTYVFEGKTVDGKFKMRGIHHVAAGQCTSAAYSYWTGSPAVIARLHNATLLSLASNTCTTEPPATEYEVISPPGETYPPTTTGCGGTGSGTYPPLAEDEWYDWFEGVRYRCRRDTEDAWSTVFCTAEP